MSAKGLARKVDALAELRPRVVTSLRLRLELKGALVSEADKSAFDVREVGRAELDALLPGSGAPVRSAAEVDRRAAAPWRAFVARSREGELLHHSFVQMRASGPFIFLAWTRADQRNRGALRATARHLGRVLGGEGHRAVESSCDRENAASRAAFTRAGFAVIGETRRVFCLGFSLRRVAARALRPIRSARRGRALADSPTGIRARGGGGPRR